MSSFSQNSTIASRVDHSPMYTAADLVVDVILEAARATVCDGSIPARTANEQRVPANVEEIMGGIQTNRVPDATPLGGALPARHFLREGG